MQADYSSVMPFIVKALLDSIGAREGYRLYEKRDALVRTLIEEVGKNGDWLADTLEYPLAAGRS